MAAALENGDRVEIRGLCSFYVKGYEGYTGRNPKTGETVAVAAKKNAVFQMWERVERTVEKMMITKIIGIVFGILAVGIYA